MNSGRVTSSINSETPQPFLVPVPPADSESFSSLLWPIAAVIGIIRTSFVLIIGVVYLLLVEGVCLLVVRVTYSKN